MSFHDVFDLEQSSVHSVVIDLDYQAKKISK